jgi:hypothetical protein
MKTVKESILSVLAVLLTCSVLFAGVSLSPTTAGTARKQVSPQMVVYEYSVTADSTGTVVIPGNERGKFNAILYQAQWKQGSTPLTVGTKVEIYRIGGIDPTFGDTANITSLTDVATLKPIIQGSQTEKYLYGNDYILSITGNTNAGASGTLDLFFLLDGNN